MFGDDENLEETVRSIARELGRSVERALDKVEPSEFADRFGVDPDVAREWVDGAGGWLRARVEGLGDEVADRMAHPADAPSSEDPLRGAAAHPLDTPTDEQGLALAALDSGRWIVEPGSGGLSTKGEGPGPSDALGIVRELRVRDWITADGEVTLVGRHALSRWLDAADPR